MIYPDFVKDAALTEMFAKAPKGVVMENWINDDTYSFETEKEVHVFKWDEKSQKFINTEIRPKGLLPKNFLSVLAFIYVRAITHNYGGLRIENLEKALCVKHGLFYSEFLVWKYQNISV